MGTGPAGFSSGEKGGCVVCYYFCEVDFVELEVGLGQETTAGY